MSLYKLSNDDTSSGYDDSQEDDDAVDGLLMDLHAAAAGKPPAAAKKKSGGDDSDSDGGWSDGSDDSTSHSNIELEEASEFDQPSLVAKGRVEPAPVRPASPPLDDVPKEKKKGKDKDKDKADKKKGKDNKKDKKDKKKDTKKSKKDLVENDEDEDDAVADLEMLLEMKMAEKKKRDASGKVDAKAEKELEKLKDLLEKTKKANKKDTKKDTKKDSKKDSKKDTKKKDKKASLEKEAEKSEVAIPPTIPVSPVISPPAALYGTPRLDDSDSYDEEIDEKTGVQNTKPAEEDHSEFMEEEVLEEDLVEFPAEPRSASKRRGLFGSFFGSRHAEEEVVFHDAAEGDSDQVNDSMVISPSAEESFEEVQEPTQKKRGFFSFLGKSKKAVIDEDDAGERPIVENSFDEDVPPREQVQSERSKTRGGFFSSFRRPDRSSSPGTAVESNPSRDVDLDVSHEVDLNASREAPGSPGGRSDDFVDARPGYDSGDDVEVGQRNDSKKKDDYPDNSIPTNWKRIYLIVSIAAIIIIVATFATAYFASKLALEKKDLQVGGGGPGGDAPTPAPTEPSDCLNRQNSLIEVSLTFDSQPAEVGLTLRDAGTFGTGIWVMEPGSFRSFSQFQRENNFQICLSSVPSYVFEITDSAANGLVSKFGESSIFGSWDIRLNLEVIASYRGDCNTTRDDLRGFTNRTLLYCGEYSKCIYNIFPNETNGECEAGASTGDGDAGAGENIAGDAGAGDTPATADDAGAGNATAGDDAAGDADTEATAGSNATDAPVAR